jgi:Fe-S cluster biogenesis protein NfuA
MAENQFETKVKEIIDEQIRPYLQADGGDVEIVRFEGNNVIVKLRGACAGCAGAIYTLKVGIEGRLKEEIPEFGEVIAENF